MTSSPRELQSHSTGDLLTQPPCPEYFPPASSQIRAFAREVCDTLAAQTNNPLFTQAHVIWGLSELLELAARAQVRHLNQQQCVDKEKK